MCAKLATMCLVASDHAEYTRKANLQKTKVKATKNNRARNTGLADDMLKYKQFKRFMQAECHRTYNNYIASSFTKSTPSYQKIMDIKRKDHCGVGPLKQGSTTYTDSLRKANLLNQYFSSVLLLKITQNLLL